MILGLGERDTCFKMSKVRSNDQIEYKKNAFSMNHFGQNFHFFFIGFYFLEIFEGIKEKVPKYQKGSKFS